MGAINSITTKANKFHSKEEFLLATWILISKYLKNIMYASRNMSLYFAIVSDIKQYSLLLH